MSAALPGSPRPFVLVPGLWLGAWAWDRVTPLLEAAGHPVRPLTLPGLDAVATDRSGIDLTDHVDAVVAVLQELGRPDTVLVAHSGAGTVATGALDRSPGLVGRMVYVDSGPAADRSVAQPDVGGDGVEVPMPGWDELAAGGASTEGLSPEDLSGVRRRAVPHPAGPLRQPLRLSVDPSRDAVPATMVCCSIRPEQVRQATVAGDPMFAPVALLTDLGWVDLPTGHWPMFSEPEALARALLRVARGPAWR